MISALVQADLASEKINGKLKHYIPHSISEWYEEVKQNRMSIELALFAESFFTIRPSSRFEGNIDLGHLSRKTSSYRS